MADPSAPRWNGEPGYLVDYGQVLRAILWSAAAMRQRDQRAVLACLFAAGVRPSGFVPPAETAGEKGSRT